MMRKEEEYLEGSEKRACTEIAVGFEASEAPKQGLEGQEADGALSGHVGCLA